MKKRGFDDKGFTLVELIVVLVILAILAAILVPALLGYIDEAKEKQYVLDARNMMQAAQAEFISLYAKGEHRTDNKGAINYGITDGGNNDAYVQNSDFAKKVLSLSEISPYTVMIGAGSYEDYFKTTWFEWSKTSLIYCSNVNGKLVVASRKKSKPDFYTLEGDLGEIDPYEERVFERIWLDDFDINEFQQILDLEG